MQPTPEIENFVARVVALPAGPGVSLDAALQPSLDEESELRKLFATDKENTRLSNPHVGLVDIYDAPDAIRTTRARVVGGTEDLSAKYVMPLSETNRREEGTLCMAKDLEEFKRNWSIFTEGSLSQLLDWNNVVAAGGSVLACLGPLSEASTKSKRSIRKYYHSNAYPTSDVDLFLWGMNAEEAEAKIVAIYEAVRDSVPWDVTCVRTKHTVSIHSQYPYRSVQIVLRLYQSPAEILAGFDIDAPCCAYDGDRVWANPRAVIAMMRQCNTVDMSRRSPSYEVRLAKYSARAFEVYVPNLQREDIDPTIYERAIAKMEGLARLLVLEKLTNTDTRYAFLENRRTLRGRPDPLNRYNRRNGKKYKGDLKGDTTIGGLEMNDYDVASLHIPYGPGWDARRIDKLIYQTDLGMNSTFNPKNKGRRLHRHPAFFGTIEECLDDCCEACPVPIDDDERALQIEEDEQYIRGRIKFIEENPGRQTMTGSFNPIDVGEWSAQVYVKPTQQLFAAIAAGDRETVQLLLKEGIDVHQRDHVGRTCLHVAIMCKESAIACDIIDGGARMIARLVDGRTSLHLAAQNDLADVIRKMFEKSGKNQEEADAKKGKESDDEDEKGGKTALERPSSEDDWSSNDDDDIDIVEAEDEASDEGDEEDKGDAKKAEAKESAEGSMPEDEEDEPDIIEVDQFDWDFGLSALDYAILFASLPTLEQLILNGADVALPSHPGPFYNSIPLHPLTLTIIREDEDEAADIAERLIKAGATSSTANEQMRTIFHFAVSSGRAKLVATILRCDPGARSVIDFPAVQWQTVIFPVVTAIDQKHYAVLAVLLAYGAKIELDEADVTRAQEASSPSQRNYMFGYSGSQVKNYLELAYHPVETALKNNDDIVQLLIAVGADVNIGLKKSLAKYSDEGSRRTIIDWVNFAINSLSCRIQGAETIPIVPVQVVVEAEEEETSGWKRFLQQHLNSLKVPGDPVRKAELAKEIEQSKRENIAKLKDGRQYLLEVKGFLVAKGAKGWTQVYPFTSTKAEPGPAEYVPPVPIPVAPKEQENTKKPKKTTSYILLSSSYTQQAVPEHQISAYDELFEACYVGDNEKIQKLCLPGEGVKDSPPPININVIIPATDSSYYSNKGYTPLFAAIAARRWSTAKLVLAICTAQYHPDDKDYALKWDNSEIDIDDDSDNESCDSDDSDITIEKQEFKFVDIATRPSAIRSNVHPRKMLQEVTSSWRKNEKEVTTSHLLQKAVMDHDLEGFVHIANLYQSLPQPLELSRNIFHIILDEDQHEMLDEFIRRTGFGIDMKGAQKDTGEPGVLAAVNDDNRIYLGLNVHGKKRVDLARKNDPNAHYDSEGEQRETPLVWQAARLKAKLVVDYLSTDKPFTAYRFYATTHSDKKAIWLRKTADLEKLLPAWLGWTITPFGESPLTAAIIGGDLRIVKLLAAKSSRLISNALQEKIKFVGFNPLLLAVHKGCKAKLIDYLLSRSVSPAERDLIRGWNIYHYICDSNYGALLEHFLAKLPRDVNEALLAQQSKSRLNTPLLIAVKKGNKALVEKIVNYSSLTILSRDVDGQTSLHVSVKAAFAEITKLLLAKTDMKGMRMENGVGNTIFDMAALSELNARIRGYSLGGTSAPSDLPANSAEVVTLRYREYPIDETTSKRRTMRSTIDSLLAEGRLKNQTQLTSELINFLAKFENSVLQAQSIRDARPPPKTQPSEIKYPTDTADKKLTLQYVREALEALPGRRQLVHLIDVQKSVAANLERVAGTGTYVYRSKNNDELEEEEDKDEKDKRQSMIFQHVNMSPDGL